ncbi:MAG TPA: hypothetical protein VJZ77_21295 [Blastocatellia bacterium]|nr:hypothetical protein [Blastocatellia bacterium]
MPFGLPLDQKMLQMATRQLYDPGVILFRDSKSKKLLLLFLVGETPTGGIHKFAFKDALRQIDGLAALMTEGVNKKALRIIGPSFSGSADSLAILLKAWIGEYDMAQPKAPPPAVRIVSGSAGTINKDDFLDKIDQKNHVSFDATIVELKQATNMFHEYLMKLDSHLKRSDGRPASTQIAWLSETGTGYGQGIRRMELPTLSLTFPQHISQIRVETERESPSRDKRANALTPESPNLALPMGEAGSPTSKDSVPPYSPLETVTMELALGEMLSEINRERIRYVGVSATDPLDRIFLVREIRKNSPNTRIFFMPSAELLYLHSETNLDFQGALVISPYPLFSLNQLWTYPFEGDKRRLQFSSHTAQGLYNATLELLEKRELMLEYGSPFCTYNDDRDHYPALWLGVVGRNGIWPVTTFDIGNLEITEQSCERLKSKGVSTDVLVKLQGMIDQKFNGKKQFLDKVKELIGDSQTNKHEDAFLEQARNPYTLAVEHNAVKSQSNNQKNIRFGLMVNYWSPTGIGVLLLIGIICLLLPLVFFLQLILFWGRSKVNKANPNQWREGRSKPFIFIINQILELERGIEEGNVKIWLRPFVWIRRGWLGWVFGDEDFYCYGLERRIILLSCCACLLTVTLIISSVVMLPKVMTWKWKIIDADTSEHWWELQAVLRFMSVFLWGITLAAFAWLAMSISAWINRGRRHFNVFLAALLGVVVCLLMLFFVVRGVLDIFSAKLPEQVFFFLRATELTSGVSVLLPGFLVMLAAFLSLFNAARRLNLVERMPCLRGPREQPCAAPQFLRFGHEEAKSFEGLKALEDRVKEMIVCPSFKLPWAVPVAIVILIVYWRLFLEHFIPSVDGPGFDCFFKLGFYIVPLLLVWALMRFFWLWYELSKLLQRLSWHPLISQYAAEHSDEKRFASLPNIDLMTPTPTSAALSASVRQARLFYEELKFPPEQAETVGRVKQLVEEAENKLSLALKSEAKRDWQKALQNHRDSQEKVAELTEPVAGLLEKSWRTADEVGPDAGWWDEGRFFLITQVVAFLQHVFAHLQNLVSLVTIGLLLLLVAANSYPFQPRQPLQLFSWVGIMASVVVTLFIFVKISRDKTLSLLAGTAPGRVKVSRDFVMRVLVHGLVPIVALLGAQFPGAVRQIISWLSVFEGKGS